MRETRLYGSEGGEAKAFPTPIHENTCRSAGGLSPAQYLLRHILQKIGNTPFSEPVAI